MKLTPEQEAAAKAAIGPMLKSLGMDMGSLDELLEMVEEFQTVKRTTRVLATWARNKDPEGFAKALAVIVNAEKAEEGN